MSRLQGECIARERGKGGRVWGSGEKGPWEQREPVGRRGPAGRIAPAAGVGAGEGGQGRASRFPGGDGSYLVLDAMCDVPTGKCIS